MPPASRLVSDMRSDLGGGVGGRRLLSATRGERASAAGQSIR